MQNILARPALCAGLGRVRSLRSGQGVSFGAARQLFPRQLTRSRPRLSQARHRHPPSKSSVHVGSLPLLGESFSVKSRLERLLRNNSGGLASNCQNDPTNKSQTGFNNLMNKFPTLEDALSIFFREPNSFMEKTNKFISVIIFYDNRAK